LGIVSGIPTLNPVIVMNYELGWDRTLPSTGGRFRLSVYHETLQNILAFEAGSDYSAGLISIPANIGDSEATGLELSLDGRFRRYWRWGASYTPEIIRDSFEPGFTLATTAVNDAQTTPVHVVNLNLGWARGRWETQGYLRYESAFYGIERSAEPVINGEVLTPIPDYVSVDSRIAYKLSDRFTLSLSGQNLLSAQQLQTSGLEVERRVFLSLQSRP
jgi:iron complex outermembrane receptor protein